MDKGIIRREFFKLRLKQKSYSYCRKILAENYKYSVEIRTLKRWQRRFEEDSEWNLCDDSRKPRLVHFKVTDPIIQEILALRKKTNWGACKLKIMLPHLHISHDTINLILSKNGLTRREHNRGKRAKYVRFQRKHSNSLWHIDDSEFDNGKIIGILDDCSRYNLGILYAKNVTTTIATKFLDELIQKFGKPKAIISDNGSPYGGKSKHSKFDRWCKRRGIEHIRTRVKKPQTNGKVERLFQTIKKEIPFANGDLELFRMRYNHFRPHQSLNWLTPAQKFNQNFDW
jgi:putative transposase